MATSKLWFSLLGSSILRNNLTKPSTLLPPIRFPSSLHFLNHSYSSTTAAAAAAASTVLDPSISPSSSQPLHPWPEWITFVDRLKSKGYFSKNLLAPVQEMESDEGGEDINENDKDKDNGVCYTDSNLLKNACLAFARDRFDLLESLSRLDIQAVVEKGCPNLYRKVVNSAKRLRAHLQLDEGEVCGGCNLRGSCDRSYVILTDDEASARTVDIVRILLLCALDPSVFSDGKVSSDRIIIETSARKLLSELIELSDTMPAPQITNTSIPLRTKKAPREKKESIRFVVDDNPQNVEMKAGDWTCSRCDFMNFARNIRCLKCKGDGPRKVDNSIEMKKGDWNCPECGFMNFASKSSCFRCRESRPARQLEPGEWECSSCNYLNYRRNSSCRKCNNDRPESDEEQRPSQQLKFGEWECPSCAYVNFRKNVVCRKCSSDRPSSGGILS